ncbi:class I SAM-dependent methyltransferase [Myxacorys almedinensis]|uniref:Class I SAM-dependent methyltransferase n=1 Tax=Myxacorys almedinensis A TaxID=2690445 RepID=A0A8J7Z5V9_9CYAN|nr:class I SAM-dependent methyltransferase [Myxacorys almedinensis]NDJ18736.1 class I SAM-dependent methyltransferase [Myxacorys almedinensis A]
MSLAKTLIRNLPGVQGLHSFLKEVQHFQQYSHSPFLRLHPPGHFYSPIPSPDILEGTEIFNKNCQEILGVDLKEQEQLSLLHEFATYYNELPFTKEKNSSCRYYFDNQYFRHSDGIILYSMLRHFKPKRVIEIGSGFSSAVMLDTNDAFFDQSVQFTFIEPYPERLYSLLNESDQQKQTVIVDSIQKVDLQLFETLESSDILFIDSSHVVKVGSDVAHIIFEILPRLKPGVIIHFHDIFYSFEYPESWIKMGFAWNEAYVLRAFLQFNPAFHILYFNSLIGQVYLNELEQNLPLCLENTGGSIWIRKVL